MELPVWLEQHVHHTKLKLLVHLDLMEFHAFTLMQLDKPQELNHVEQKNAMILLEHLMINALDRLLEKIVFQTAKLV